MPLSHAAEAADHTFSVGPSPLLVAWSVLVLAGLVATVICALKGRWGWVLLSIATTGLAGFVGATRRAVPGSVWDRRSGQVERSGA